MAVQILVDSASDINEKEAKKLGVTLLPIEVRFEEKDYLDGVTLDIADFYEKLDKCVELPKTSQISPIRFQEFFDQVVNNGDEAVVICLSSKLSGSYNNAKMVAENYPGKIFVIDSLNACVGERILCEYAIQLKEKDYSAEKIAKKLNDNKTKIRVYGVLNTLKFLKKGGRISPLVAFAGEMMSVKPIISVTNGEIILESKAMGFKKGLRMLLDMATKNCIDNSKPYTIAISDIDKSSIEVLLKDNYEILRFENNKKILNYIGCTIGTHLGPGTIAIAYFEK